MWVLSLVIAVLAALLCVRHYAKVNERKYVLVVVAVSWSIGFFVFLVLPFDLEHAYCQRCLKRNPTDESACTCLPYPGIEALRTLIPNAYRTTMLLGYVMNDLLRSYVGSGEFTRRGKMKDTLKEFASFYVPFTLVSIVFLIYLISSQGLTVTAVRMMVTGLFNAIGLFILVAFLGYGLVEVPRRMWHRGDTAGQLRYLQFKVALQSEDLHAARRKLEEVLESVKATDAALRAEAAVATNMGFAKLQAHMAQIMSKCPARAPDYVAMTGSISPIAEGGGGACGGAGGGAGGSAVHPSAVHSVVSVRAPEASNRRALVSLHVRLKEALDTESAAKGMYEVYVRQGIRQADLLGLTPSLPRAGLALEVGGSGGASAEAKRRRRILASLALRAGALCCLGLSLLVVWCEGTIMLSGPPFNTDASPLSWLLYGWGDAAGGISADGGGLWVLLLLFVVVLYCAWCTFFSMFNNCVHPLLKERNSSGSNLLFNATYACRLGPPLCFNLLKLLHEADASARQAGPGTFFMETSFGAMDKVDLLEIGDYFSDYAPLLIVLLCGCTALHLGSALLSCCGTCFSCLRVPSFSFDDDFSDGRIDTGSQILMRERQAIATGSPLGAHMQLLSGATSDEESNRQPAAAAATRPVLGSSATVGPKTQSNWRKMIDD